MIRHGILLALALLALCGLVTGLAKAAAGANNPPKHYKGYIHVYGECPIGFQHVNKYSTTLKNCYTYCNQRPDCASFHWKWFRGAGTSAYGYCRFYQRMCKRTEYKNIQGNVYHTYIRLGHPGMRIPGFGGFVGRCADLPKKALFTYGSQNPRSCAKFCNKNVKCRSFILWSEDNYCLGYAETCTEKEADKDKLKVRAKDQYSYMWMMNKHRNLAFGKTTTMSVADSYCPTAYAVDGNKYGLPGINGKACAVARSTYYNTPYFMVQLGGYYLVRRVVITNRNDDKSNRMKDFFVAVVHKTAWSHTYKPDKYIKQDQICAKVDSPYSGSLSLTCPAAILGKSVLVQMMDQGRKRGLTMCEIEVYKEQGFDPMKFYDEEEKKHCTGMIMRANYYSKTVEECALICLSEPKCGAFLRTRTKVAWCNFWYYGCEEDKRKTNARYNLYLKSGHPGMEVVGYTHHQGKCKTFKHFRRVTVKNNVACAEVCNAYTDCEGFWWYFVSYTTSYCYLSKEEICGEDALIKTSYNYHMYSRTMPNVALGRKAYASSTEGYYIPSRATDGILGVLKHLRTCFSSQRGRDNWWSVDLGFNTVVKRLYLFTTSKQSFYGIRAIVTDDKPRNGHALKFVDNEICDEEKNEVKRKAKLTCKGKRVGRYVVVHQQSKRVERLILCEVIIMGMKDYKVNNYVMEEDKYCTYHDVIPTKKLLTPVDCADVCDNNVRCVSFSYKEINLAMQCWFKGATCETKMTTIPKSYKKTQKWMHYVKSKHPGMYLAGFDVQKGKYFGGYALHNMYAFPDECAHWCNKNAKCRGIRLYWTGVKPYCSPLSKFPEKVTYAKNYYYYTFAKTAPNIAIGKKGLGEGKYLQGPIDGLASGYERHHSCFISKPKDGRSWWAVDLALLTKKYNAKKRVHEMVPTTRFFYVTKVSIMNRADCCFEQLKQLLVIVTDNKPLKPHDEAEICAEQDKPVTLKGKWLHKKCRFPLTGQYVVIRKEGNEAFAMCEVMVDGWASTDTNVALKKKADISSYKGRSKPDFAVDGKKNTNVGNDMCAQTLTNLNGKTAWWAVDLAKTYFISSVNLRSRSDCCPDSLRRFTISVSTSKPRWNFEPISVERCNFVKHTVPLKSSWSVKCKDPAIGRHVIVSQNEKGTQLTICEAEIYGREMKIEDPIGFWPLTAGLKGTDVAVGTSKAVAKGHVIDALSRPGPLNKPYTAFTIKRGGKSSFLIPSHKKIRTSYDFTFFIYIFQSSRVDDSTILTWDSGDRKLLIKNQLLVLGVNSAMENYLVKSTKKIPVDKWVLVGASFDRKTGMGRVFIDDHETEKFLGKSVKPSSVNMDDIVVGKGHYVGGIACMQLYKVAMKLMQFTGAASRCKEYMKRPGDQAVNVAKKLPAFQSSTWNGASASRAVDGDDAPNMWRDSCSATIPNKAHWWAVDLQALRLVTSVKITNRLDCCHTRLRDFRILVTTDKPSSPLGYDSVDVCVHQKSPMQPGQTKTFSCREGGLVGNYVAITKPGKDSLTICEVQIFGDKVLFQPKKGHQFIWRSVRISETRRGEKKVLNEVANLKLCQRACLFEKQFKCLSVEYEYLKKRCRLYDERIKMADDTKTAKKAALEGWFVTQKGRRKAAAKPKKDEWNDLKQQVKFYETALKKVIKSRDLLKSTLQNKGHLWELIVFRVKHYQDKLKVLTKGQVSLRKKLSGRLQPGIARSPFVYSEARSVHPKKLTLNCPTGKNRLWALSANWVLNQAPMKTVNGIEKSAQCDQLCSAEINFICMAYAFNKELKTCSMWDQNTATPSLKLVQKLDYTYAQWGCGGMPAICSCYGSGDPHYRAFNGVARDYQKPCKFTAAKSMNRDDICTFDVESKNERYPNPSGTVSVTVMVELKIFGHVFKYSHGKVTIDGKYYPNLSEANRVHPGVKVYRTRVEVPRCQLWVTARHMYVKVEAGKNMWTGKIEGYCGNCGSATPAPYNFPKYEVPDDSGIGGGPQCMKDIPAQKCTGKWAVKVKSKSFCGFITDFSGPFKGCLHSVNRATMYKNCEFDVCQYTHNPTQARVEACDALSNLAEKCASLGKKVAPWRKPDFCPMECGRNAVYLDSTTACPATCDNMDAPKQCTAKNKEGCACKTGFVLNGKLKCVIKELCAPKSLADIVFLVDMSDLMGPQLTARAKDLVADIVDTFDISAQTTQISVMPYACTGTSNTLLYSAYPSRTELVEAIRGLPFIGGCSKLPIALQQVYDKVLNPSLEKLRPGDIYSKLIVLVTPDDVADNDAVVERTKILVRRMGKVMWFKFNSQKAPKPRDLTIKEFIFPISDPTRVDQIIDDFNFMVYKEVKCGMGMYNLVTKFSERCKDIDECRLDVCSKGSTCVNTNGQYRCICKPGYCFHNSLGCIDNNECSGRPCLPGSTCKNTLGSFTCTCKKGFKYHPKRSCYDINECAAAKKPVCMKGSVCKNTLGSYECECAKKGFVYKEDAGCTVGDACLAKKPCKGIAKCYNVKAGFQCRCPTGYKSDGKNGCQEIDLCKAKPCKGNKAVCRMTGATFTCICPEDFDYTRTGCKRKDPCLKKPCKGNAECTSENGEFYCACKGDMYYNEEVGCEEAEIQMPESKLVMIIDGSGPDDNKHKLRFPRIRQAALNIGVQIADKSEKLNMGLIVLGGTPRYEVPQSNRLTDNYDILFEDVLYKGGKFSVGALPKLISENKELKKPNTEKIIIVVLTHQNIKWSEVLEDTCKKTRKTKDKKSYCHYAVALYGTTTGVVDKSQYMVTVESPVELLEIWISFRAWFLAWMHCPAGFVHNGGKCQKATTVVSSCKYEDELFAIGSVWASDCNVYVCMRDGYALGATGCPDYRGRCFLADGVSKYRCMSGGKLHHKCSCTVRISKTRKIERVLKVIESVAPKITIYTDKEKGKGKLCVFPFVYQHQVHYECTNFMSDVPWCATVEDLDHDMQSWGYCVHPKKSQCAIEGIVKFEGDTWVDKMCNSLECRKAGLVTTKRSLCPSNGADSCVPIGTRDYPCEIEGKTFDSCVCSGTKERAEYFAVVPMETVQMAYGDADLEYYCLYGEIEVASGKTLTADCNTFKCTEERSPDANVQKPIGATLERVGEAYCAYGEKKKDQVCIKVGETKNCDKTPEGAPIKCKCFNGEDGPMISKEVPMQHTAVQQTVQQTVQQAVPQAVAAVAAKK